VIVGILAGLAVAGLLFKPLFRDIDGLMQCLRFWVTPDVVSAYRGELSEDWSASFKLGLWLACIFGASFSVWYGLEKLFS